MFFPAVFVSAFSDSHAALRSVGIDGEEADSAMASATSDPLILDALCNYEGHQFRIGVILSEIEGCEIGLWFGNLEMVADTPEEARLAFVADFLSTILDGEDTGEPPTVSVFQLPQGGAFHVCH